MDRRIGVGILTLSILGIGLIGNKVKPKEEKNTWGSIPKEDFISGDYYSVIKEKKYGGKASLEVVVLDGRLVKVEFNEVSGRSAASRYYQGLSKRLSEYNFLMAEEGSSWLEVIGDIEEQYMENNSLVEDIDIKAGATSTVIWTLLPMAKELNENIKSPTQKKYYELTRDLEDGRFANLRVIIDRDKIDSCMYDEVFASNKKDILDEELKKYYRQSKYNSHEYRDPSKYGFNIQMDELNNRVVETQDFYSIDGILGTQDDGYRKRNPSFDIYIDMARELEERITIEDN